MSLSATAPVLILFPVKSIRQHFSPQPMPPRPPRPGPSPGPRPTPAPSPPPPAPPTAHLAEVEALHHVLKLRGELREFSGGLHRLFYRRAVPLHGALDELRGFYVP